VTDDFRDLLQLLVDAGARFLVVGAHALAAHGVPRVTGDLDLWIEPLPENAHRVWLALSSFGAPLADLSVRESDLTKPDIVAQFGLPPFRIDIMTSISGVSFDEAWEDRFGGHLFGVRVDFLGRKTFVQNKRASGRPKDLSDVQALDGSG
jgi:hypothetical protein